MNTFTIDEYKPCKKHFLIPENRYSEFETYCTKKDEKKITKLKIPISKYSLAKEKKLTSIFSRKFELILVIAIKRISQEDIVCLKTFQ